MNRYTLKLTVEIYADTPEAALVMVYERLRAGFTQNTDRYALLIRSGNVEQSKEK